MDASIDDDILNAKVGYFRQLRSLSYDFFNASGEGYDGDEFDALEEEQRQRHRSFFHPPPKSDTRRLSGTAVIEPAEKLKTRGFIPGRSLSDPVDLSKKSKFPVIKATPSATAAAKPRARAKGKSRMDALVNRDLVDVVCETPAVGAVTHLRLSSDQQTELMPPLPGAKRLSAAAGSGSSPSVGIAAKRRKKGDAEPKLQPEHQQVFRNLVFFYIPDNDISPLRRIRINKAREYGARWTRDVSEATHVIVDSGISYKAVEAFLSRGKHMRTTPVVVNDNYPLDCIQFRVVLEYAQAKYLLAGHPTSQQNETTEPPPPSSDESIKSLQLKPPPKDAKKWDYAPPKGTPSQSEEPSQNETPILVESQRITIDLCGTADPPGNSSLDSGPRLQSSHHGGTSAQMNRNTETSGTAKQDELAEYISIMREFKDVPLDAEEDDDDNDEEDGNFSTTDRLGTLSDGDESVRSASVSPKKPKHRRRIPGQKNGPSGKVIAWEDRFACNQAGEKNANSQNPNARTIEVLQSMTDYYDRINDHWRTTAYRKVITTLKRQSVKITTEEEAFQLPNVGRRLAQKIEEIVTTDGLRRLEYAKDEPLDEVLQTFLKIYGVGSSQAHHWIAQGFRTLDDLKQKAKLTTNQAVGIAHYDDLNTRIPRKEVEALGDHVKKAAARIDPKVQLIVGGSYRRGAESSGDIDLIVTKPDTKKTAELAEFLDKLVRQLEAEKFLVVRLASSRPGTDGSKWHGCCVLPQTSGLSDNNGNYQPTWRRIDFLLVPESETGAALIYFTGNDIFNRSLRLLASKKGMRLNQRGLYRNVLRGPNRAKVTEGELVEGRDERRIFEILGVKWREPHERWC